MTFFSETLTGKGRINVSASWNILKGWYRFTIGIVQDRNSYREFPVNHSSVYYGNDASELTEIFFGGKY